MKKGFFWVIYEGGVLKVTNIAFIDTRDKRREERKKLRKLNV